jgi:hypothetical protein
MTHARAGLSRPSNLLRGHVRNGHKCDSGRGLEQSPLSSSDDDVGEHQSEWKEALYVLIFRREWMCRRVLMWDCLRQEGCTQF